MFICNLPFCVSLVFSLSRQGRKGGGSECREPVTRNAPEGSLASLATPAPGSQQRRGIVRVAKCEQLHKEPNEPKEDMDPK